MDIAKTIRRCLRNDDSSLSQGCNYCDFEDCEEICMTCKHLMADCVRLIENKDFERDNSYLFELKKSLNECVLGTKKHGVKRCTSCRYFKGMYTTQVVICVPLMEECLKELEQIELEWRSKKL